MDINHAQSVVKNAKGINRVKRGKKKENKLAENIRTQV
jgi:hypothetical protein